MANVEHFIPCFFKLETEIVTRILDIGSERALLLKKINSIPPSQYLHTYTYCTILVRAHLLQP